MPSVVTLDYNDLLQNTTSDVCCFLLLLLFSLLLECPNAWSTFPSHSTPSTCIALKSTYREGETRDKEKGQEGQGGGVKRIKMLGLGDSTAV